MSNRDLWKQGEELDSIYLCSKSFRSAKLAAGSLLAITEEVLTDRVGFFVNNDFNSFIY